MNLFTAMFTTIALLASTSMEAQTMAITRGGSRPVRPGPTEHFTGSVRVERLFEAVDPSHAGGGSVTFEPRARTAWHSHPRGQILIVTAGIGRVQRWGDPVEEIRTGDVVRIAADQKHWRVASVGDDAHRHLRAPRRHGCAVDGKGERRAVQRGAAASISRPAAGHAQTVGTTPAKPRARLGDLDR